MTFRSPVDVIERARPGLGFELLQEGLAFGAVEPCIVSDDEIGAGQDRSHLAFIYCMAFDHFWSDPCEPGYFLADRTGGLVKLIEDLADTANHPIQRVLKGNNRQFDDFIVIVQARRFNIKKGSLFTVGTRAGVGLRRGQAPQNLVVSSCLHLRSGAFGWQVVATCKRVLWREAIGRGHDSFQLVGENARLPEDTGIGVISDTTIGKSPLTIKDFFVDSECKSVKLSSFPSVSDGKPSS